MSSKNYGYLYNIEGWGEPYFAVNSSGNVSVKTNGFETTSEQEIDLLEAVNAATAKKIQFPLILRFPDVLKHRLDSLYTAFINAIHYTNYNSHYQGVFPVKVHQLEQINQELTRLIMRYLFFLSYFVSDYE